MGRIGKNQSKGLMSEKPTEEIFQKAYNQHTNHAKRRNHIISNSKIFLMKYLITGSNGRPFLTSDKEDFTPSNDRTKVIYNLLSYKQLTSKDGEL